MFSVLGWRAYSQGRGESVTRCDRRQREREFDRSLPPLARPCESHGAGWVWVFVPREGLPLGQRRSI